MDIDSLDKKAIKQNDEGMVQTQANDIIKISCYSFDPGTVNMGVAKVYVIINPNNVGSRIPIGIEWFQVINVKYAISDAPSKTNPRTDDQMTTEYFKVLSEGPLKRICDEFDEELKLDETSKLIILIEEQMDVVEFTTSPGFKKPPIMYCLQHCTKMFFYARYGTEVVSFNRVHGKSKDGLKMNHGRERKQATSNVAISYLRSDGFDEMADSIELLKAPKPREDICDAYLAGRLYLLGVLSSLRKVIPHENFSIPSKIMDTEEETINEVTAKEEIVTKEVVQKSKKKIVTDRELRPRVKGKVKNTKKVIPERGIVKRNYRRLKK